MYNVIWNITLQTGTTETSQAKNYCSHVGKQKLLLLAMHLIQIQSKKSPNEFALKASIKKPMKLDCSKGKLLRA